MAAWLWAARAAVDRSAPTHRKFHPPQLETGYRGLRGPVPLQPLLFFPGHQQSGQKAPQIKMGTPVISLHRWSTQVADCFHPHRRVGGNGYCIVPEANTVRTGHVGSHDDETGCG